MSGKFEIFYPVRPFKVNQRWGDNIPCVRDFGLPTQTIVSGTDNFTCPVGYTKLYDKFGMSGHNGTDLMAGVQNVYAAHDGVVIEKQTVPARGLGLGILTDDQYDFGTYGTHYIKLRYWHLKSFNCEVGDRVKVGDIIGTTDNTGYSSGNHLHFEGNPMDKDSGGHPYYPSLPNAIAGSIDLQPYFTGFYADDYTTVVAKYNAIISILQKLVGLLSIKNK